ncbi:hypothetical protein [Castellaniella denitrificans]|uniref:Uncharacterized protein n=1 Tax=Castellaniella denitrificans TaxID=56119 RepID=A0ABT4M707_9BURK|nr:hypothetical protein [Castellaniella denitrificans]MCZ4331111.1 hypothetical protein [Castellaniella denitrificans]
MSKYDSLIAEFPEEGEAILRLCQFLDSPGLPINAEFKAGRLFDIAKPSSNRALVLVLSSLVQMGLMRRFVRVESDAMGGIGDYPSVSHVPQVMFDTRLGIDVEVRLDQVCLMYAPTQERSANA